MRDKCANLDIRGVTDPFMLATEWLGLRGWARISRRTRISRKTSPPRNRAPLVGASEEGSVTL